MTVDYVHILQIDNTMVSSTADNQVILAGMFTGERGDIRCKVLAAFSTVK